MFKLSEKYEINRDNLGCDYIRYSCDMFLDSLL